MKRLGGIWLIFLIVGMSVSVPSYSKPVAAATSDPYEAFWQILNREAELVVQFNSTGNASLAQELIQNSHLGAENAANISALIWQALEELKASGVKTYYTAEELREMAQNISQNGLPDETVEALKEQGWTDEQIQALKEYIVQNADEINEDFNMTAFLEDFSMAFINVAFKYNEYEAWTLRKWKWTNAQKTPQANDNYLLNPALGGEWTTLYFRYLHSDYQRMEPAAKTLRQSMYNLLTGVGGNVNLLFYERGTSPSKFQGSVGSIVWVEDGGLLFTVTTRRATATEVITETKTYYWPNALRAYKLVNNIYALIRARNRGNNNTMIDSILNQKIAELKEALKVEIVSSKVTRTPIKNPKPITPIPIKPGDPGIPDPRPKPPLSSTLGTGMTSTVSDEDTGITVDGVPIDQDVLKEALDPQSSPGTLMITDIAVVVDKNVPGEVKYHVKVSFKAENNAVNNIRVSVKDYTTGDSDSGTVPFLNSGESHTWNSKEFTYTHSSGGELTVSGRVEITYTPSCNDVPLSKNEPFSASLSCQERTITKDYSATIDLTSPVDWSKVNIRVEASRDSITKGESVTYRVIVENRQSVKLDDVKYSVTIPFSPTNSRTYSGTVDVQQDGEQVILERTVTYTDAGTYVVHASIYWNGHSKSAEKSVTVTSGTLSITGVDVSPVNPTHGDTVSFDVSLKNPVSRSRALTIKLFIDGVEKSSKSLTIGAEGSRVVSLTWTAQAGDHEWRIEVWEGGKLEASRSGGITVSDPPTSACLSGVPLEGHLEVYPEGVEAGDSVSVHITVTNLDPNCAQGPFNIELVDDSGALWWPKKDMDYGCSGCGYVIQERALKIYAGKTMSEWTDFNNIDQATTLYLKVGGKTLASAKINVKQDGPIKASMECKPTVIPLDGSTTCTVHFELKSVDTVTLNLEEVDFGGKKVWPNGPSSVTVNKRTVTLTPTNMQEDLTITINIDDELADYYFGKPIYRTYIDKFAGHSYLIKAEFSEFNYSVSDVIKIIYKDTRSGTEKAIDYGSTTGEIISTAQLVVEGSNPVGWIAFALTSLPKLGKAASEIQWIFEWGVNGFPQENDNNAVVGG
ncbi:hypothetical protein [Thermococcus sp. 5-4]|uniref:hypothetical protein n=1 Tax=Thermococcus sp. 5-4 TaxID=2008440 RepID=UPI000B49A4EB|nr:hypothetical protein [Thermococcus sp. 5-4]ASA78526.1 hypothetical protein CDI07_09520 [Thermococcus sp. 5-4]